MSTSARVTVDGNEAAANVAYQTVKALLEAESYPGPSLLIAYAHCIAHGVDMTRGLDQQKRAVGCGHWPLFRYDPRAAGDRKPFTLDSRPPSLTFGEYAEAEGRYRSLSEPHATVLRAQAQSDVDSRWRIYQALATRPH